MKRDVFISYSRKNYDTVMEIKRQIDDVTGADCWIDLNGIESGSEQFDEDIIGGINNCQVFLFMLSEESQQSEYALLELNFAKKKRKRIVLVNIDNCELCDKFEFKYGLTDTIAWRNVPQRDKLLRDVNRWVSGDQKEESKPEPPRAAPQPIDPLKKIEERITRLDKEVGELKCFEDSNGKKGFKDKSGKVVIPCQWNVAGLFHEGLAPVMNSKYEYGFIDKSGKVVIPCQWNHAYWFSEGLAHVEGSNGKYGFIDKSGKLVILCKWCVTDRFSEGLARVKDSNGKWGFINKNGKLVIPSQWDEAYWFRYGLARVKDSNGKWGFIDKSGKAVIPCKWDFAFEFSKGLARVQDSDGKWGFIDKSGKVVIPCQWNYAYLFREGHARVMDSNGNFWKIDKTGKVVGEV